MIPKRNLDFGCSEYLDKDGRPSLSPMTELAVNFELSSMSTPRRKLSLSTSFNATPERAVSVAESLESGIEAGSPLLTECAELDSPSYEIIRTRKFSGPSKNTSLRRQLAQRSFSSPVLARKPFEPLNFDNNQKNNSFNSKVTEVNRINKTINATVNQNDLCNQIAPSALLKPISAQENAEENHSDLSLCEMSDQFPELEDEPCFQIKKRKYATRSFSAPTVSTHLDIFDSGSSSSNDDGFFDENTNELPICSMSSSAPTNFVGLIKAPIVSLSNPTFKRRNSAEDKENRIPKDQHVFQKPNCLPPFRSRSCSLPVKRESPATVSPNACSRKKRPRQVGRSQSVYDTISIICPIAKRLEIPTPTRALQRSQSFDVKQSKPQDYASFFDVDDKNLIGDKTKPYCLPTCASKHPDLKGIDPETLSKLMNGDFKDEVDEFCIIDSRYPYEFDGGHIKGALNIYEKEDMIRQFLRKPPTCKDKRNILIFHCEFSSKRGPAMCRFLRNKDRDVHQETYPDLFYPEIYLLEGGYKEFFAQKKEYCEPQSYREMLDPDFQQDLKRFSKRSKSWSEDKSTRRRLGMRL